MYFYCCQGPDDPNYGALRHYEGVHPMGEMRYFGSGREREEANRKGRRPEHRMPISTTVSIAYIRDGLQQLGPGSDLSGIVPWPRSLNLLHFCFTFWYQWEGLDVVANPEEIELC